MVDINLIRNNIEEVKTRLATRGFDVSKVDEIAILDRKMRELLVKKENLTAVKNQKSKTIGLLKDKKQERDKLLEEVALLKNEISTIEDTFNKVKEELDEKILYIPNLPAKNVIIGKDENDNKVIKTVGDIPNFDFNPKAHWDLAITNALIDFDRSTKVTGSRFIIYTGLGARLYRALQLFCLHNNIKDFHCKEIHAPVIVHSDSLFGTGNLPKFKDDLFKLDDSNYYLSPTAEVQLTNLHRNEIIKGDALPFYYTANTSCFRSEAGSAGKDTRGVIRQHQFNKVEIVKIVRPETSWEEHETLTRAAETILEKLNLPYRRIQLCTGDMGFSSAMTYDIEVYLPSYQAYKEISSCSNCLDFQARRAKIRYRDNAKDDTKFVHTLNGSSLAIDRLWAAVVENYQKINGEIEIPEALKPFLLF
ncbi:serine--tRNA ligase [Ureaplasma canigenitalium]|uniref:serine--tRNA ligase n=1 Tax=Ureaplasma canigenitalium TaxID=42092 RepID=UPI0004E2605A|nr:serine--tRNA ligase [Ureaplasma canigenitalium]